MAEDRKDASVAGLVTDLIGRSARNRASEDAGTALVLFARAAKNLASVAAITTGFLAMPFRGAADLATGLRRRLRGVPKERLRPRPDLALEAVPSYARSGEEIRRCGSNCSRGR